MERAGRVHQVTLAGPLPGSRTVGSRRANSTSCRSATMLTSTTPPGTGATRCGQASSARTRAGNWSSRMTSDPGELGPLARLAVTGLRNYL